MGPKLIGPSPLPTGGSAGPLCPSVKRSVQGVGSGHVRELRWKSGALVRSDSVQPCGSDNMVHIRRTDRPRGTLTRGAVPYHAKVLYAVTIGPDAWVPTRCIHVTQQARACSMIWAASRRGKGGR